MWSRCVLTVASEMNSRAAAPRLVSPWAISVRTSSSRSLSASCAGRAELADQPRRDRRRQHRLAAGRGPDRPDQLVARRVLEQVAGRAGLERRHDVAVGVVGRQDEHPRRHAVARARARIAAAPPMPGIRRSIRMTSGSERADERERLGAVAGLADDLEVRVAREHARAGRRGRPGGRRRSAAGSGSRARAPTTAPAAIAGTRAETAVPPPGSDSIASEPATRPPAGASRSGRTRRPVRRRRALGHGNPTPSSRTSSATTSPMYDSVRPARVAPACLATFASASWAVRSSATSISGWRAMTSPVTVTSTGIPLRSDQSRATSASASGRVRDSSAAGHRRLDRAARLGQALAGQPLGVRRGGGRGRPAGRAPGRPPRAG